VAGAIRALTSSVMPILRIVLFSLSCFAAALLTWSLIGAFLIGRRKAQQCPSCDRKKIRRSMRRLRDRFVFRAQPFRCVACNRRFYLPTGAGKESSRISPRLLKMIGGRS
jgi:hypothetical protein